MPADDPVHASARAFPASALDAETLQRRLAPLVEREDRLPDVRLVAGVDVGYAARADRDEGRGGEGGRDGEAGETLHAGIVTLDATTLEVVESVVHAGVARFAYVPGLFSFRELPPLLAAFERLERMPDLVVCDGQGIAHPRRFGLACHLGLALDVPSIGCAKSVYVGEAGEPGPARGSSAPVVEAGETVGAALRTRDGVKPVYVSIGHRTSLDTALAWVLRLAPRHRQPETTRAADALVRRALRADGTR